MSGTKQPLLAEPAWRPEDLGRPLPDSPHANSVCLPTWRDVVDYEEKAPRVREKLRAGYPRFVMPPAVTRYLERCRADLTGEGECFHAYPSRRSAERCAEHIRRWSGGEPRVVDSGDGSVHFVCFPRAQEDAALKYWRHSGDGISSRRAEALLEGRPEIPGNNAARIVRERIGSLAGVPSDCVFLFKTGMAAIYTMYRAINRRRPDGKSIQFGFPYVDTLKIQQDFGPVPAFFPVGDDKELADLDSYLETHRAAGLFCEFPSNPLLASPAIDELAERSRKLGFPLIVDDTLSTWINVSLFPPADVLVTSLTKYFTGQGDVMAGAVVLNPDGPHYQDVREALLSEYDDCLWGDDLVLVERYSRDFEERMRRVNQTSETVCDWLHQHPRIERVYFPKFETASVYARHMRPGGGYGGLFSILLKDAPNQAPAVYDRLAFSKGPNLGTVFSLCCPFTLLAHYDELPWAESCGVSRYLLRFSIGLEDPEDLIARLDRALG